MESHPHEGVGLTGNIKKVVLVLEYDGTSYYGFQLQDTLPTIQGELEKGIFKLTGEMSRVISASRTDTGVHARGQVVSFRTGSVLSTERFLKGLNFYLPRDIGVKAAYRANEEFNVRRDAVSREYKYYILNRTTRSPLWSDYSFQIAKNLNIENMNQACEYLRGRHDFLSFATGLDDNEIKGTVRDIHHARVEREGEMVVFEVTANSFLRHQVRNAVGSLIKVGLGKISIEEFSRILEAKVPGLGGPTVPAKGLCLEKVNYPEPLQEILNENI